MSPDTIFAQAIEIASPRERAAFLEEACRGDKQQFLLNPECLACLRLGPD